MIFAVTVTEHWSLYSIVLSTKMDFDQLSNNPHKFFLSLQSIKNFQRTDAPLFLTQYNHNIFSLEEILEAWCPSRESVLSLVVQSCWSPASQYMLLVLMSVPVLRANNRICVTRRKKRSAIYLGGKWKAWRHDKVGNGTFSFCLDYEGKACTLSRYTWKPVKNRFPTFPQQQQT